VVHTGFAVGITCCAVSLYQTEICTTELRGAIGTVFQLFVVVGLFVVYLVGSVITWRSLALMALLCSIAGFFLTFLLVESPIWLIAQGEERWEEARLALASLRDPTVGELDLQFAEMQDTVFPHASPGEETEHRETGEEAVALDQGGFGEIMNDPVSLKALGIGVGLMLVQQLSGINAVMFYAGEIYGAVPNTSSDTANDYSTMMQLMQVDDQLLPYMDSIPKIEQHDDATHAGRSP